MEVVLVFKGRSECVALPDRSSLTDDLFAAAAATFDLQDQKLKILCKGKQVLSGMPIAQSPLAGAAVPAKCMVMATGPREVAAVLSSKSGNHSRSSNQPASPATADMAND